MKEGYKGPTWRSWRLLLLQERRGRRASRLPFPPPTIPLPALYRAPLEAWRREQEALAQKVAGLLEERMREGYFLKFRSSLATTFLKVLKELLRFLQAMAGLPPDPEPQEGLLEPLEAEERAPPLPIILIGNTITPTAGP